MMLSHSHAIVFGRELVKKEKGSGCVFLRHRMILEGEVACFLDPINIRASSHNVLHLTKFR